MDQIINEKQQYIEEVGFFFDNMGVGRTPGRIIGALIISSIPHLTMKELANTLKMSKASISNGLQMLTTMGFVSSFSIPGKRSDYYKINRDFWIETVKNKFENISLFKKLIGEALEFHDAGDTERKQTLEEMHAMYSFFENKLPQLFDEWEEIRKRKFG